MRQAELDKLETLFLALGDKTRLRLLSLMATGPVAVGLLVDRTGESQPKVSRHLAYLRNCGLVTTRRDGKHVYYAIDNDAPQSVRHVLETVIGPIGGTPAETRAVTGGSLKLAKRKATPVRQERIYAEPEPESISYDYEVPEYEPEPAPAHAQPDDEMDVFLL